MNWKLLVLLAVVVIAAGGYFCFGRTLSGVQMKECEPESAKRAVEFAEHGLNSFRQGRTRREKHSAFAAMDAELTAKLEQALEEAGNPDFSQGRVFCAEGDPDTFCVDVPSGGGTVRFIVERQRGGLVLAACARMK